MANIWRLSRGHKATMSTILTFHGFTGSGHDFESLAGRLEEQCNWYALNLHQQSDMGAVVASVDSFLGRTALAEIIILGYSMGGRIALQYALARPERVALLILIGVSPGIENDHERELRRKADHELGRLVLQRGTRYFIDNWHRQPLIASQKHKIAPLIYAAMMSHRYSLSPEGIASDLVNFGLGVMPNCWPFLANLQCQTLLITGAEDKKFHGIASRMQSLMPRAQHIEIPASGHAAHLEQTQVVIACLTFWLKKFAKNQKSSPKKFNSLKQSIQP